MELKQKSRFLLALLSLLVFLSLVQDSYAKYISDAEANTNMTIARWNILINNQDIVSNSNFSNKIIPTFLGDDYTSSGIIAPNSEGYFDLIINHTNVDVAFNQTIDISLASDNTISDLKIVGYSLNNGEIINFSGSNTISSAISLNPSVTVNTYRIYVKWIDGEDETMDNEADTNATISGKASLKVDVSFVQIVN